MRSHSELLDESIYITYIFRLVGKLRLMQSYKYILALSLLYIYLFLFHLLEYILLILHLYPPVYIQLYRTLVRLHAWLIILNKPLLYLHLPKDVILPNTMTTSHSWRYHGQGDTYTLQLSWICLQLWRMAKRPIAWTIAFSIILLPISHSCTICWQQPRSCYL